MKTENDLLKELYIKSPRSKGYEIDNLFKRGTGKHMEYNLFSWITGESSDKWISFAYFSKHISKFGYTTQLYYDVVVLGIDDISKRPKCRNCGKPTRFNSLSRGYFSFCDLSCTAIWGNKVPSKRANVSKALTGKKLTKEHRHSLSVGAIRRIIKSGSKNGMYKSKHGNYKPVKSFDTLTYDSSWELLFMKLMDNNKSVISIRRANFKIPYKDSNKEDRNYIPDFIITLINGDEVLVEIKPQRLRDKFNNFEKYLAGKKFCYKNNLKYLILTENELLNKQVRKTNWLDIFYYLY